MSNRSGFSQANFALVRCERLSAEKHVNITQSIGTVITRDVCVASRCGLVWLLYLNGQYSKGEEKDWKEIKDGFYYWECIYQNWWYSRACSCEFSIHGIAYLKFLTHFFSLSFKSKASIHLRGRYCQTEQTTNQPFSRTTDISAL